MIIHCLPVSVYRYAPFGDCTNNGISNRFDDLLDLYCGLDAFDDFLHRFIGHGAFIDGLLTDGS